MTYIVQNTKTKSYLASPEWGTLGGKPDALWPWSRDKGQAHQFTDRGEAKRTLRQIDRRPGANLVKDCTFFKV